MATHSSILAWRISWTEEPGGLQSTGLPRVGHDWSDLACTHTSLKYFIRNTGNRYPFSPPRISHRVLTPFQKQDGKERSGMSVKWQRWGRTQRRGRTWMEEESQGQVSVKDKLRVKAQGTLGNRVEAWLGGPRGGMGWESLRGPHSATHKAEPGILRLLFSCSVASDSLWPHGLQNARLPCPSPSSGAWSSSNLGAEVLTKRRRGTSPLQQDWGCCPAPPHRPWQPQAWGGSASLPLPGGALSTLPRLTGWEAGWRPQPYHQVTSGSAQLCPPTLASSWLLGFELGPEPILLVWASNPLHKLCQLPSSKVSPPNAPQASWLGGDLTWTDHFGAAVYLTLSSSCCWKTPSGGCPFHPRRCEEMSFSSSTFKLARCHPSPRPHHSDHDGCLLHKGDPYLLPVTHVLMPPSATAHCCCCLVTKSCLTLCNTTDWSMPGPSVISACFTGRPFFALPLPPRLWSLALDSSHFWHLKEDLSSGGGLVSSCERTRHVPSSGKDLPEHPTPSHILSQAPQTPCLALVLTGRQAPQGQVWSMFSALAQSLT